MSYLDADDLIARFGATEIDDLAPPDDPDARAATINNAITDACAEIDGVISEVYVLPLRAGTWPLLRAIGVDIARAQLYDDLPPERVLGRASAARNRLKRIGAGELRLLDASGLETDRHPTVLVDAGTPIATRENLSEYLDPSPASHGPFDGRGRW